MDELVYWPLLMRYLAGECTPAEHAQVDEWIVREPGRRDYVDSLRRLGAATSAAASDAGREVDPVAALERVRAQLSHLGRPLVPSSSPTIATTRSAVPLPNPWRQGVGGGDARRRTARGAVLLMALSISIGIAIGVGRHGARSSTAAGREYATAPGRRLSVTLVDGTQLTLAPASRVRVVADFGRTAAGREVELEGEAYFAVVHDAAHPFAVRTRDAVVRDVGTAFDVRAYPEDAGARIAVAEGTVMVTVARGCRAGRDTCDAQTHAGKVATVSNAGIVIREGADIAALTAWMQGQLVFEDAPLSDVAHELDRAFDIQITIADSGLAVHQVSGVFDNETVDQVLDDITGVIGGRYERVGRTVVIRRNLSRAAQPSAAGRPPMQTAQARNP